MNDSIGHTSQVPLNARQPEVEGAYCPCPDNCAQEEVQLTQGGRAACQQPDQSPSVRICNHFPSSHFCLHCHQRHHQQNLIINTFLHHASIRGVVKKNRYFKVRLAVRGRSPQFDLTVFCTHQTKNHGKLTVRGEGGQPLWSA